MDEVGVDEVARAVEAARQPLRPPAMPSVALRLRLRTSTRLRGLEPTSLMLLRAAAKARAAWETPDDRRRALAATSAIVSGTPREAETEELARRRLLEEEIDRALYWRPWPTASLSPESAANLRRTFDSGRRVLISACHLGPYFLQLSPVAALGQHAFAVAAPWFFDEPTHDYWGRRLARWWHGIAPRNERLVYSVGSFPVLQRLLEEGEVVMNYFDMPWGTRTQFLGKPVMLASGSTRLAFNTQALVLPLRARRAGNRVWTDVFEPLDSRDFASQGELHTALAAIHERSILELPETLEDPNRPGAWENAASWQEWARSRPPSPEPAPSVPSHERSALGAD